MTRKGGIMKNIDAANAKEARKRLGASAFRCVLFASLLCLALLASKKAAASQQSEPTGYNPWKQSDINDGTGSPGLVRFLGLGKGQYDESIQIINEEFKHEFDPRSLKRSDLVYVDSTKDGLGIFRIKEGSAPKEVLDTYIYVYDMSNKRVIMKMIYVPVEPKKKPLTIYDLDPSRRNKPPKDSLRDEIENLLKNRGYSLPVGAYDPETDEVETYYPNLKETVVTKDGKIIREVHDKPGPAKGVDLGRYGGASPQEPGRWGADMGKLFHLGEQPGALSKKPVTVTNPKQDVRVPDPGIQTTNKPIGSTRSNTCTADATERRDKLLSGIDAQKRPANLDAAWNTINYFYGCSDSACKDGYKTCQSAAEKKYLDTRGSTYDAKHGDTVASWNLREWSFDCQRGEIRCCTAKALEKCGASAQITPALAETKADAKPQIKPATESISAAWVGEWTNSRGQHGSWTISVVIHPDGKVTGMDDGQEILDGIKINNQMTWRMKQSGGSRWWTETVTILPDGSIKANYTGHDSETRYDDKGVYTGSGTLRRKN
jgi:hypothetical protein